MLLRILIKNRLSSKTNILPLAGGYNDGEHELRRYAAIKAAKSNDVLQLNLDDGEEHDKV